MTFYVYKIFFVIVSSAGCTQDVCRPVGGAAGSRVRGHQADISPAGDRWVDVSGEHVNLDVVSINGSGMHGLPLHLGCPIQ